MSALRHFVPAALFAGGVVTALPACDPAIETDGLNWNMELLASPEITPGDTTAGTPATMEWCPQVMFSQFNPLDGTTFQSTTTPAPTTMVGFMSVENDDLYTISPPFNASLFGPPIVFDVGPIGTFYTKSPTEFVITGDGSVPGLEPLQVNVVRDVVGGSVHSETDFDLSVDYTFDCEEIRAPSVTCSCETQRLTWNLTTAQAVF